MQFLKEKLEKANAKIAELESKTTWQVLTTEIVYRKVGTDVEMIITAGETDFSSAENINQGTLPEGYRPLRGLVIPLAAHTNAACTSTARNST